MVDIPVLHTQGQIVLSMVFFPKHHGPLREPSHGQGCYYDISRSCGLEHSPWRALIWSRWSQLEAHESKQSSTCQVIQCKYREEEMERGWIFGIPSQVSTGSMTLVVFFLQDNGIRETSGVESWASNTCSTSGSRIRSLLPVI